MALMIRSLGVSAGSRSRRGLRAAFRGSIAALGVARLHLGWHTAGGALVNSGVLPVLSPLASSD